MVEPRISDFGERWFGAEGDAQPRFLDHQSIVSAVTNGEHLFTSDPHFFAGLDQGIELGLSIDDWVLNRTAELATVEEQAVRTHAIEAEKLCDWVSERHEATSDQDRARSPHPHGPDQCSGAGIGDDTLGKAAADRIFV